MEKPIYKWMIWRRYPHFRKPPCVLRRSTRLTVPPSRPAAGSSRLCFACKLYKVGPPRCDVNVGLDSPQEY